MDMDNSGSVLKLDIAKHLMRDIELNFRDAQGLYLTFEQATKGGLCQGIYQVEAKWCGRYHHRLFCHTSEQCLQFHSQHFGICTPLLEKHEKDTLITTVENLEIECGDIQIADKNLCSELLIFLKLENKDDELSSDRDTNPWELMNSSADVIATIPQNTFRYCGTKWVGVVFRLPAGSFILKDDKEIALPFLTFPGYQTLIFNYYYNEQSLLNTEIHCIALGSKLQLANEELLASLMLQTKLSTGDVTQSNWLNDQLSQTRNPWIRLLALSWIKLALESEKISSENQENLNALNRSLKARRNTPEEAETDFLLLASNSPNINIDFPPILRVTSELADSIAQKKP